MLNPDLPVQNISDDKLNRGGFAKELAAAILSHNMPEGLVIGMYGAWGSGKTSVINMIVEQLKEITNPKPIIMRFNPWLCADQKQLISQFFKQLSSVIKKECPYYENICGYMKDYSELFELAGNFMPTNIGVWLKFFGKKQSKKASEHNNNLQEIKDKISKNLRELEIRLIVTIDDIDRLSNTEIVSVFQLVKSLADFPFITYLLAFDREIVTRALGDVQKCDGAEYLEKIVQAPFELPMANSEDIYKIFFTRLENVLVDLPEGKWEKYYWSDLFNGGIKHYLDTIRDVIRFTNTLSLKFSMLKNEVNAIDLIGITCLQVFEPDVYSRLPFYKESLCGTMQGGYREEQRKKLEVVWENIISDIPEEKHERIKSILWGCFPKLVNAFGNGFVMSPQRNNSWRDLMISNSISSSGSFNRYFSLTLENEAIPTSHLEWMVMTADANEFTEEAIKINADRKSTKLFEYIDAAFSSNKSDSPSKGRARLILNCLCKMWCDLEDNEETVFFATPFTWRFYWCTRALLQKLDEIERYDVMCDIFRDSNVCLPTIAMLLNDFELEHNRFVESKSSENPILISEDNVLELEKLFVERATAEMMEKNLIIGFNWYIIHLFENIAEDTAKSVINEMISTDYGLVNLVKSAVGGGKRGDRETTRFYIITKESIEKYIDINTANERIKAFVALRDFNNLDAESKKELVSFLLLMERETTADFAYRENEISEAAVISRLATI